MKLALGFRNKLSGDLYPVRQQFDQLKSRITAGWNIEHTANGQHSDIHATSVEVNGESAVAGPTLILAEGMLTAATITAAQNNYLPIDNSGNNVSLYTASVIRLNSDASRNLTGLVAPSPARRHKLLLLNVGAQSIVLVHSSSSSTDVNRFIGPNSADVTVRANGGVWIYYDIPGTDVGSGRWRVIGI